MPRRKQNAGRYFVSADDKNRMFESVSNAVSLAQTFATRAKSDGAFYVREVGTQGVLVTVERIEGVVYTRRAGR